MNLKVQLCKPQVPEWWVFLRTTRLFGEKRNYTEAIVNFESNLNRELSLYFRTFPTIEFINRIKLIALTPNKSNFLRAM